MSLLDETDLGVLTSKLKPLQSNLLGKWVQGLATGGDREVILSNYIYIERVQRQGEGARK